MSWVVNMWFNTLSIGSHWVSKLGLRTLSLVIREQSHLYVAR